MPLTRGPFLPAYNGATPVHAILVWRAVRILRVKEYGSARVRPYGQPGTTTDDHLLLPRILLEDARDVSGLAQRLLGLFEFNPDAGPGGPTLGEYGFAAVACCLFFSIRERREIRSVFAVVSDRVNHLPCWQPCRENTNK